MKNLSKLGFREYVFVAIIFVIPVAMVMLVFSPRSKANAKMRDDTSQMRTQLVDFGLVRDGAMSSIKKDIAELEKATEYLDKRVPQEPETEKTLGELSALAEEHNLRRKKSSILTPLLPMTMKLKNEATEKKKDEYGYRVLTIELEGGFNNFYSFLQAVEKFSRIIHVEQVDLQETEQEGWVEVILKLRIFFRQNEKEKSL